MAENEILDVGNSRRYRRWHKALADANCSASEVADCLVEDFTSVFRKKLRGKSLSLVLNACGDDRKSLQEAVASFKDRALAKLVEQAFAITRSKEPKIVARKIAELLIDGLVGQANRYAFHHAHGADYAHHQALERAAIAKLEACKSGVVESLTASLRGERTPGIRRKREERPSAGTLVMTSLMPGVRKPSNGARHV